jgi:methylenetetrahydrofolate reductase (NADPH)
MKPDSRLSNRIAKGEFIVTAEYLPSARADLSLPDPGAKSFNGSVTAVNVADNPFGVALSSLAGSMALSQAGIEPIYQLVTRDRNRIAIQSDLLGAASLGIRNVLCLSGYHQTLTTSPESANVYDIDSIQLLGIVSRMRDQGVLLDGTRIEGSFALLAGAAANPYLRPLELNLLRLAKKIQAGAGFIQTHPVFDIPAFAEWLKAAKAQGLTGKTAILAGVLPLRDAAEAKKLRDQFTDFQIPDGILQRLERAGNPDAQRKEGVAICAEIIREIRKLDGLRGIHIQSGGNEAVVPLLLAAAGL